MRKGLIILLLLSILLVFPKNSSAHPGNTSSDGCHYCRTNCDSWGVPWNQRHCHGGYTTTNLDEEIESYETQIKNLQTSTPTPTVIAIPTPTPSPTPKPTPRPTPTPTIEPPVQTPEVKGETVEKSSPTPTPLISPYVSSSKSILSLILFFGMIGGAFLLIRKVIKKFRGELPQN